MKYLSIFVLSLFCSYLSISIYTHISNKELKSSLTNCEQLYKVKCGAKTYLNTDNKLDTVLEPL